jgi:hypothetical protein
VNWTDTSNLQAFVSHSTKDLCPKFIMKIAAKFPRFRLRPIATTDIADLSDCPSKLHQSHIQADVAFS